MTHEEMSELVMCEWSRLTCKREREREREKKDGREL